MKTYLVGGAVRDKLLGLVVKDRDWVVVGAGVQQMLDAGYTQVGRDFPVFLHPVSHEEYALARTERKQGKGYTGFVVHADPQVTLEEDLQRRDLTINAIAQSDDGAFTDPFNGLSDIENRKLRHVSAAFTEDPLRVLRVARFAARFASLGFTIAEETMSLMQDIVASGELDFLIAERVWQEFHKALLTQSPGIFFAVLRECGALKVLLPELENLFGVPQPANYHPEIDTGVHTMMVLEQATLISDDPIVRFAALVHDLGKAATDPTLWPSHKGHEEAGATLVMELCQRLRIPKAYRDLGKLVSLYHTRSHRALKHNPEQLCETLEYTDAFRRPERFSQFLLACEADAKGRLGLEQEPYHQSIRLQQAFAAACNVDIRTLSKLHSEPAELIPAIRLARCAAIAACLAANTD